MANVDMGSLPFELKLAILEQAALPPRALQAIGQLDRSWRAVSRSNVLWRAYTPQHALAPANTSPAAADSYAQAFAERVGGMPKRMQATLRRYTQLQPTTPEPVGRRQLADDVRRWGHSFDINRAMVDGHAQHLYRGANAAHFLYKYDASVLTAALANWAHAFVYVPENMRHERRFWFANVQSNMQWHKVFPEEAKEDRAVVLAGLTRSANSFRRAPKQMREDATFCMQAVQQNAHVLRFIPSKLQSYDMVAWAVAHKGTSLQWASMVYRTNPTLQQLAVSCDPNAFFHLNDDGRRRNASLAVGQLPHALAHVPLPLRGDAALCALAISGDRISFFRDVPQVQQNDDTLIALQLRLHPETYSDAVRLLRWEYPQAWLRLRNNAHAQCLFALQAPTQQCLLVLSVALLHMRNHPQRQQLYIQRALQLGADNGNAMVASMLQSLARLTRVTPAFCRNQYACMRILAQAHTEALHFSELLFRAAYIIAPHLSVPSPLAQLLRAATAVGPAMGATQEPTEQPVRPDGQAVAPRPPIRRRRTID